MDTNPRIAQLKSLLGQRILVIDGAMGTAIQALDLGPDDFGGPEFEGCNENLILTRPDAVAQIHQEYLLMQKLFQYHLLNLSMLILVRYLALTSNLNFFI